MVRVERLPAASGWAWVRDGWAILRRQPLAFTALLMCYLFALLLASLVMETLGRALSALVPLMGEDLFADIGKLCFALLIPGMSAGFMIACRSAQRGVPVYPNLLIAPFRQGRQAALGLLALGVLQAIAVAIVLYSLTGPDAEVAGAVNASGAIDPAKLSDDTVDRLLVANIVALAATLPVTLVLWYAPVLIIWHGMSAPKAMFFSASACWRNRAAFTVYGLVWMSLWLGIPWIAAELFALVGLGSFSYVLIVPIGITLMAWMYCSFYPTYASVFFEHPVQ